MDREMLQMRLEEAERHVAQGLRHIAVNRRPKLALTHF